MRPLFITVVALALCGAIVHAAENIKEIDSLLRSHGDAVARADKARTQAVGKSRDDTIAKLVKLAGRAYSDKDRVSETSAWRSVLQLDRQHQRARKYFSDLGTLDQVEIELGEATDDVAAHARKLVGKWSVLFNNRATSPIAIPADGVVRRGDGEKLIGKITVERGEMILRLPADIVERYTIAGEKLFVEQWAPASTYPQSAPSLFGYGVRVD